MEQICPPDKCTACFACANICPQKCIAFSEDSLGALHPVIDQNKCIDCKLCEKTCPVNNEVPFHEPLICYAAWRTDTRKRFFSASGGIGAIFAEYVVSKEGVVFGTQYDSTFTPITSGASSKDGIEKFKGSKYVQSIVGTAFSDIKQLLTKGSLVLYIATPCQIAGLLNYLKKPYDNLITVDLICHGVVPTSYFKEEIAYLVNKNHIDHISNISFRGNGNKFQKSLNYYLTIFDGSKIVYHRRAQWQYYFLGFLKGITFRENCFSCKYASPKRISDITIGDFIGLGKSIPFNGPKINTSAVIVNTEKGKDFISKVMEYGENDLNFISREYSEAVRYGPSLNAPFPRHPLTSKFRSLYYKYGYTVSIRKLLFWPIWLNRLGFWPRKLLIKAPRKLLRILKNTFNY